ncbi:MAG TPA: twin-arginine translocase subunit TatC [Kineosporiaceae bacterium]|nr:twin-arginine translocase subunit TatC [Kineosporiaceae bacterium]
MALREHLAELRRRVLISALAIVLGAVAGWFLASPAQERFIVEPVLQATAGDREVFLNYSTIGAAFNIKVKVAMYISLVISSPVWIYQLWAFITPGLTRKERRYTYVFVLFAVPLFLSGVALAILLLPKAIAIGSEFGLDGATSYQDAEKVITFASRLIIALGVAFLAPLFLVGLNLAGVLSGRALGKQWRIAVFISFLFAAIVSPSPDVTQMILMALPLTLLYTISVFICLFVDRRRRRKREADPVFGLSPDEASPLPDASSLED